MLTTFTILTILALAAYLFINSAPFGSTPSGDRLARIKRSPQYRDGSFQNIEPTDVMRKEASMMEMARDFSTSPPTTSHPNRSRPFALI